LLFLPPPDLESRRQIFKLGTKDRPLENDVDFNELAERTDGYSSADVIQICDEAADIPLEEALAGKTPRKISHSDFLATIKNRKSSIKPWFKLAAEQIKLSGEEEEFSELLEVIKKYVK
jgi:transitional endoplasmic reticulum ATPase